VLDGFTSEVSDQRILQTGSIRKVKTHLGGMQSVVYELNQYYDSLNQADRYGGGIRVKTMIIQDGIEHDRDIVKHYSYLDRDGKSSGCLIYKPMYANQIPIFYDSNDESTNYYSDLVDAGLSQEEIWKRMTIRTVHDLHKDEDPGYNVAYSVFKESIIGLGDRLYQFDIPFTYSFKSSIPYSNHQLNELIYYDLDGNPRTKTQGNENHYQWMMDRPHTRDYQWNGLISSMTTLSATGDSVSASFYNYARSGAEWEMMGLRIDQYPQKYIGDVVVDATFWRPYSIKIRKKDILTRRVDKTYDDNGASIETITDYTYTDSLRLRSEKTILNDGTSYTTEYQYVDDFSPSAAATNAMAEALFYMREGWNYDQTPIEVITTYDDGSTQRVTNASLTLWDYDAGSIIKPQANKSYRFISKNGVNNFTNASVASNIFNHDNRYELMSEVIERNGENQPIASLSRGVFRSGIHYGEYGEVKLTVSGAYPEEVLFSDFEGDSNFAFDAYNENNLTDDGRVQGKALTLNSSDIISGSCLRGLDSDYVVAFWMKSSQVGQLQITITDGSSNSISENIAVFDTDSGWSYVKKQLPIGILTGNNLTVSISSSTTLQLDDLAAYPLLASVNHTLYGVGFTKLAETNAQGNTVAYEYDGLYRPESVRNKEGEIIGKQEYGNNNSFSLIRSFTSIFHDANLFHNHPITFTVFPDIVGATYEWKIMDNEAFATNPDDFSGATTTPENTFTTSLEANQQFEDYYVVKVRVNYAGEVLEGSPIDIRVVYEVPEVEICANRPQLTDQCNLQEVAPGCVPQATQDLVTIVGTVTSTNGSGNYVYFLDRIDPVSDVVTVLDINLDGIFEFGSYLNNTYRVRVRDQGPIPGPLPTLENGAPEPNDGKSFPIKFSTFESSPGCNGNN